MGNVHDYILAHWQDTIHPAGKSAKSLFALPRPFTVPCIDVGFTDFYYWDTYFTNLGLLRDGLQEQALHNLENISFLIEKLGYMPNADHILYRSQPPLFTRGVADYFESTKDLSSVERFLPSILKELAFFENHRQTPCGLNAYSCDEPKEALQEDYLWMDQRIGFNLVEKAVPPEEMAKNLLSIAESGWDFNPRFQKGENRFCASSFAHLDLNCLLFDAEKKAAQFLALCGRKDEAEKMEVEAERHRLLIQKLMKDPSDGVFYDYDFTERKLSHCLSAASFYPMALGISSDPVATKKVLSGLLLPFGLSTLPYRGKDASYLQWDYPSMWPSNVYFALLALKATHLKEEERLVRNKFVSLVDKIFAESGQLWEKYDASKGTVSLTREYVTPPMMGWTAGVYEYCRKEKED
jgi:alpha,alpha-trehalase